MDLYIIMTACYIPLHVGNLGIIFTVMLLLQLLVPAEMYPTSASTVATNNELHESTPSPSDGTSTAFPTVDSPPSPINITFPTNCSYDSCVEEYVASCANNRSPRSLYCKKLEMGSGVV